MNEDLGMWVGVEGEDGVRQPVFHLGPDWIPGTQSTGDEENWLFDRLGVAFFQKVKIGFYGAQTSDISS